MTATSPTLELDRLDKRFGDFQAVRSLSLSVLPGTVFGLLGPNGAGKTTTLRMIMDIIAPDAGTVRFFGRPRARLDLERVGYLPEERGLYRKMTVLDQLEFLGRLHGLRAAVARREATSWLERVGLGSWRRKKVGELSKGMQQKVQLIGTVLHSPEILVLDEPFSGLDPINQELFKTTLATYRDQGRAILLSTHIMEQAEKLCDHLCLMSRGEAILSGPLEAVKRRFSGNAYRLVTSGAPEAIAALPEVLEVLPADGSLKLVVKADARPERLLRRLVGLADVHEFRSEAPDLEEIFIRAVRESGQEEGTECV